MAVLLHQQKGGWVELDTGPANITLQHGWGFRAIIRREIVLALQFEYFMYPCRCTCSIQFPELELDMRQVQRSSPFSNFIFKV